MSGSSSTQDSSERLIIPDATVIDEVVGELTSRGNKRSFLTTNEIAQHLHEVEAPPELFTEVLQRLSRSDFEIVDQENDLSAHSWGEVELAGVSDSLRMFIAEVRRYPPLTPAQVVELSISVHTGLQSARKLEQEKGITKSERTKLRRQVKLGEQAKTQMVEANLRLVLSLSRRFRGFGIPTLDLIQEGNVGLMKAVERYDYRLGWQFSTYAAYWIRQAMSRYVSTSSQAIRLPIRVFQQTLQIRQLTEEFHQVHDRDPTPEEMSQQLERPIEEIKEAQRLSQSILSLDSPVTEDQSATLADAVVIFDHKTDPESNTVAAVLGENLNQALDVLSDRERDVLEKRFGLIDGEPRSIAEVAAEYHVNRQTIRQVELKAIAKLRINRYAEGLEEFLNK